MSRGTYGSPRVHAELAAQGKAVSRKRVSRLMREAGLQGASSRRGVVATVRDRDRRPAPDLVERQFTAEQRDRLWVADTTYIPTWMGFFYLAVVLDAWSRRIVGWSMATHLRSELVVEALSMAVGQRRPKGVIHPSDPGTQYTSIAFGQRCREMGVRPSMGSIGDCFNNACARTSLRHWNASFRTAKSSRHRPKPGWRSLSSWKGGTTRGEGIPRSAI